MGPEGVTGFASRVGRGKGSGVGRSTRFCFGYSYMRDRTFVSIETKHFQLIAPINHTDR